MTKEDLDHYTQIVGLSEKSQDAFYSWLRGVLTIASGLFAALVALHSDRSTNLVEHILFITSLSTLGGGILSGVVALYSEVVNPRQMALRLLEKRESDRRAPGKASLTVSTKTPRHLKLARPICYVLLCASVVLLVAYAAAIDIPL